MHVSMYLHGHMYMYACRMRGLFRNTRCLANIRESPVLNLCLVMIGQHEDLKHYLFIFFSSMRQFSEEKSKAEKKQRDAEERAKAKMEIEVRISEPS